MVQRGRPSMSSKEGMHKHPGASRWHSNIQKHHSDLHDKFDSQIEKAVRIEKEKTKTTDSTLVKAKQMFDSDKEVLYLIKEIEEGVSTGEVLKEIEGLIKILLPSKSKDPIKETDGPPYSDKSEPFGEPDKEMREPNTTGLP